MATITSDPTTRSRTLLFISYRDSQARASRYARPRRTYAVDDAAAEDQRLIVEDTNADADGHVDVPPRWLDIADQVEAAIVDTRNKIFALDKLHAKHVLPGFKDRSNEEREIEACTNEITRDFRRCHSLIQRISASASSHTFPPNIAPSQNDVMSTQNVQRALAAKVQELSALFRTKQRVYMQSLFSLRDVSIGF
ncbi:hypothetical protein FRC12_005246 [Ceratobasidium sp. 428]|nr:hypothetical protein FRC12_005246 [Ceratobasidium sp. 428]